MTNEIPENIKYEMLELPSKGECYSHKKGVVPVSYLTAMDENIIASKRLHKNDKAIDRLLESKILDKDFIVEDLCVGDRNAIILWLSKTGYGNEYIHNDVKLDLSTISYSDFNYFADENGLFDYQMTNGDVLKYKLPTHKDEGMILESLNGKENDSDDIDLKRMADEMRNALLTYITVSINGKDDADFIREYIANANETDITKYLRFVDYNTPRVNADIDFEELLCDKISDDIFDEEWI